MQTSLWNRAERMARDAVQAGLARRQLADEATFWATYRIHGPATVGAALRLIARRGDAGSLASFVDGLLSQDRLAPA